MMPQLIFACVVCKEEHVEKGQQTRSPWQLSLPGGCVICRRCYDAGNDARRRESVDFINIEVQLICHTCRDTMKLDGSNEQESTFTCPVCSRTVTIRMRKGAIR